MKAILVIDVPMTLDGRHICNHCPIWNDEHLLCNYRLFYGGEDGCPLKQMPKKTGQESFCHDIAEACRLGWDMCIEEIEK